MQALCSIAPLAILLLALSAPLARSAQPGVTIEAVLGYPFQSGLVAAGKAGAIAWVRTLRGVRNVWVARGPGFAPSQVTRSSEDDGQEISQLTFSPDGARLAWVRGGDHDANWPAKGDLAPDPTADPRQPEVTIWAIAAPGRPPVAVAKGDGPAVSARGVLAFIKDKQVWTAPLDGRGKAERLFFDRGHDGSLAWSPDGGRLAFVSDRGDHALIGVFVAKDRPLIYLEPSTSRDGAPAWSPDGARIAFVRRPGAGGSPLPILAEAPDPWSIRVADAASGVGHRVWRSPDTLAGSHPQGEGEANLGWAAGDRLVFVAELDNWPHLYSVPAAGGEPLLLTPGAFMVEHVSESRDGRFMVYDANAGAAAEDGERRHLFRVPIDRAAPMALTRGAGLEWSPVAADETHVAFIAAGAQAPPSVALADVRTADRRELSSGTKTDFPADELVTPSAVSFTSADGVTVHGQLFRPRHDEAAANPAVIFVHGGPPRQMLLGWHYMDYYSNAYAVNQYLANHGFVILSVNYRLGIGYGRAFNHPLHAGLAGAAEYQDVLAGARFLQRQEGVDSSRIGIWGGSYGGYLTALALARDSATFKAGVDMHGVHDWSRILARELDAPQARFEQGDRAEAMASAWKSSPDADVARWRSPVLLIQGDDDRNVPFQQTIDLARRLEDRHVPFEELVIPNEIHGFLRYRSWLEADTATVRFLERTLGQAAKASPSP
ncbi:MAG TPA: prolyl oligopeptidase family serine peptidase [Caulobacteraceae bacterium]